MDESFNMWSMADSLPKAQKPQNYIDFDTVQKMSP